MKIRGGMESWYWPQADYCLVVNIKISGGSRAWVSSRFEAEIKIDNVVGEMRER
jgi:hypothetical protein